MRFSLLMLLFLVCFSLPKGWKALRGPSLRHLCRIEENCRVKEKRVLDSKVLQALDQPFYSWGRGSQSEVFLSLDGKWVIKIPRNKKVRSYLLGRFRKGGQMKKGCMESYVSAGRELSEETAVVYVHQGEPLAVSERFGLYDLLGRRMPMAMALFPFALQERKPLLAEQLEKAKTGEEAKKILLSLLDLIERERAKGWICTDYAFLLNLGYDDGRAFRIDIGSYAPIDKNFSWDKIVKPLDRYLEKYADPSLLDWWHQEITERRCSHK